MSLSTFDPGFSSGNRYLYFLGMRMINGTRVPDSYTNRLSGPARRHDRHNRTRWCCQPVPHHPVLSVFHPSRHPCLQSCHNIAPNRASSPAYRVVRRQFYLCRVVAELFGWDGIVDGALVTDGRVENGKEGLSLFPVFVMGIFAAFVPNAFGLFWGDIVVFLGIVGTIVALLPQEFRKKPEYPIWRSSSACVGSPEHA